jgi:hypothetical protein
VWRSKALVRESEVPGSVSNGVNAPTTHDRGGVDASDNVRGTSGRGDDLQLRAAIGRRYLMLLTFAASIVALARRRWLGGARFLAIAGFVFVLSFLLPGLVLLMTNEWLAAAAFS